MVSNPLFDGSELASDFDSEPINMADATHLAIQVTVSSASGLSGTLAIEGSADEGLDTGSGIDRITTWTPVGGLSTSVTGNGAILFSVSDIGFPWARLSWTSGGGSGTATATFTTKR